MILTTLTKGIGLLKTFGAALLSPTGVLLGIATAIGVAITAFNHFNPSIEKQKEKLQELTNEYENTVQELNTLVDEINTNNLRIQELTSKNVEGSLTLVEADEIQQLVLKNKLLREQKEIYEDLERKQAVEFNKTNRETTRNQ